LREPNERQLPRPNKGKLKKGNELREKKQDPRDRIACRLRGRVVRRGGSIANKRNLLRQKDDLALTASRLRDARRKRKNQKRGGGVKRSRKREVTAESQA